MRIAAGQHEAPVGSDRHDPVNDRPIVGQEGDHVADLGRLTAPQHHLGAWRDGRLHAPPAEARHDLPATSLPQLSDRAEVRAAQESEGTWLVAHRKPMWAWRLSPVR
jgi:hypothetical protein